MLRQLPNFITLLRIALTCLVTGCILIDSEAVIVPLVLSLLVFSSDFADGRIARNSGSTSHFGAVFDAAADLFYIAATYLTLVYLNIAPLWFLAVIILKFTEFVVTSHVLKKYSKIKPIFVFDLMGRVTALLFYGTPLLLFLSFNISTRVYDLASGPVLFAITAAALASTVCRGQQICVSGKDVNRDDSHCFQDAEQD